MKKLIAITLTAFVLAACGEAVEVPPAYVGKILTKNGFKPETVPPSKFRLGPCFWYCDKLVLAEMSDKGMEESFRLFMPKDQLNVAFDVRFTMSLRQDAAMVDSVYNRIPARTSDGGVKFIPAADVYETYGKPVIREVVRTVVAKYGINEVASSREAINSQIYDSVTEALQGLPIAVKRLALADVQFPDVIVKAKELAAERRAAIQQAEAEKQVTLVKMQAQLEQARAERAIRREKAEAAKEENKIFSESVTDEYLKYKTLEVLETLANNPNTVFVPYEALDTLGLSQRVFHKKD